MTTPKHAEKPRGQRLCDLMALPGKKSRTLKARLDEKRKARA